MRTTPLLCVRRECLTCMGRSSRLVSECKTRDCALHPYRFGKRPPGEPSALQATKIFCLACVGGNYAEVKNCTGPCQLHFYRLGKNPKLKGKGKGRDMSKVREAIKIGHKTLSHNSETVHPSTISAKRIPTSMESQVRTVESG